MAREPFNNTLKLNTVFIEEHCGTITVINSKNTTQETDNHNHDDSNEDPIGIEEEPCIPTTQYEIDDQDILDTSDPHAEATAEQDNLMVVVGEQELNADHEIEGDPLSTKRPRRKRKRKASFLCQVQIRKRKYRENVTADSLASNRERTRKLRAKETAHAHAQRLAKNRESTQRIRRKREKRESEEEAALRRAEASAQTRINRKFRDMVETPEQAAARRAYSAELARLCRQRKRETETEQERQHRLLLNRLKTRSYRARRNATETPEEREARRTAAAQQTREKRAMKGALGLLDSDNMSLAELAFRLQVIKAGQFVKIEPSNES